ncbi:DUF805 domain-containing protein [Pedobacter sp. MC2016-14]|uniref:DUF805 domain-containing protein n=1 Tax=Pedobacter sp. MC2016-14 TaxID=2897327 RepID=UPI001E382E8C|nr:DUF805 domain-containing protein [Pedobacter sp. MC2016-14]MCD0489456.1 DUF805 domain-containing protein [Pedobacter sp. MC2016-14]
MEWYLKVLKSYGDFRTRSRRKEFWMFVLFQLIALIITSIIDNVLGTTFKMDTGFGVQSLPYGYVYMLYALVTLVPGIAVTVRRLHDVGKSGWFYFIALIPIVGGIWLLVLLCTDSEIMENKWGPNPKGDILNPDHFGTNEVQNF